MSLSEFHALFAAFTQAQAARRAAATTTRRDNKPRQRASGAGRRFAHSEQTRLVMALLWLRIYPTFEVLGFFFSLHKSNAHPNVMDVLSTLESLADFAFERPAKERKALGSVAAVMDAFPDVALIIDAKEQRIRRPKSSKEDDQQRPYYSGKKKAHTLKTQVGVQPDGTIGAISASVPGGANHDLTLLRTSKLLDKLDQDEAAMMDSGYDGAAKDHPDTRLYLPFKARRNHPLTCEQKAYNRHLSGYRIVVEHVNARLNQFGALSQVWRGGRDEQHTRTVRVVADLVNRRTAQVPLKSYAPLAEPPADPTKVPAAAA
jgi:DDE superfamily endonuclease